ncbi:conserved hypothetical protein [Sediminispirochaeta smaragdinae DSM 11293]|uniref:Uncharacterized protein n=2 Tax=Sediminispirochaeta TaxID=1911556 RepID=E1R1K0_SEDSS|nr:conserved hypothetical protein [Sediminispirochaeta smaragdinae DSM 11293]
MRVQCYFLCVILMIFLPVAGSAYKIEYAEQFYRLYHQNLYRYPEEYQENIWYLERALRSPFANPLNALARIDDREEWQRYRTLFYMHVNLELVKQYRGLASKYDKREAYFYNYPWKSANLDSLETAESCYKAALSYWKEALTWWAKLHTVDYVHLDEVEEWEDEVYRIDQGELDYGEFIALDLARLQKVRDAFEKMDQSTY